MRAAILLLVACASSNFLVWASPSVAMEPRAPVGSQQHPWEESPHSVVTSWVGHAHPPHELSKRWTTLPDHRVLVITLTQAVATSLEIAQTYRFPFSYWFNSELNQVVYDYDPNQFSMRWPSALVVGATNVGRDLAVPAIVTAAVGTAEHLLATIIWGVKMRIDSNTVVGVGAFELNHVTAAGAVLRLDPWMYTVQFLRAL